MFLLHRSYSFLFAVEKAHGDVLNILLQIMEDGILTDGKGRTINFKNTILVMTSNVGSQRIQEIVRGSQSDESVTQEPTPAPRQTSSPKLDIQPMEPEEVLKKMQSNPKAAELMLKASSDPEIMGAMRTAMNGSPADLLKAGRENPAVAEFLEELWGVMEGDDIDVPSAPTAMESVSNSVESGLGAIRASFEDSMSQWGDKAKNSFVSGLANQMSPSTGVIEKESQIDHHLYPEMAKAVKEELESNMRPEFLNRIDEIVVFSPLSTSNLAKITRLIVDRTIERAVAEQKMQLNIEDCVIDRIMHEGVVRADQFGARPIRRAAQRYVEDSLSEAIIQGFLKEGDQASLRVAFDSNRASGQKEIVTIQRATDGQTLTVEVGDAEGGIGSYQSNGSSWKIEPNGSSANGAGLQTAPATP